MLVTNRRPLFLAVFILVLASLACDLSNPTPDIWSLTPTALAQAATATPTPPPRRLNSNLSQPLPRSQPGAAHPDRRPRLPLKRRPLAGLPHQRRQALVARNL